MGSIASKKVGAISIAGQLLSVGKPIVISSSSIDDRVLGLEKAGIIAILRRGEKCKDR